MSQEIKTMKSNLLITPEKLKLLLNRQEEITEAVKDIEITVNTRIFMIANGSSGEGLQAASFYWEKLLGIKPYVLGPYLFNHYLKGLKPSDIVIGLSQTGTSHEVVEGMRYANACGAGTIGITTLEDTPIANEAKTTIVLPEGIEDCEYKVVGVVVNMLAAYLVGYGIALANNRKYDISEDLVKIESTINSYLDISTKVENWVKNNYKVLENASGFTVTGSGVLQEAAEELAIKIIEVTNKQSCHFDLEEYLHGGCAVIDDNHRVVMVVGHETKEFALNCYQAGIKLSRSIIWLGPNDPSKQINIDFNKDPLWAVFDAMAAVHGFVIAFGELGNHGSEGSKIFAHFQDELKVRE